MKAERKEGGEEMGVRVRCSGVRWGRRGAQSIKLLY